MLSKDLRDLDLYLDCAAKIKVFNRVLIDAIVASGKLIPKNKYKKMEDAYNSLCYIQNELEQRMLKDHPITGQLDYDHVFWGGIKGYYNLDKQVEQIAIKYINKITGGLNHD